MLLKFTLILDLAHHETVCSCDTLTYPRTWKQNICFTNTIKETKIIHGISAFHGSIRQHSIDKALSESGATAVLMLLGLSCVVWEKVAVWPCDYPFKMFKCTRRYYSYTLKSKTNIVNASIFGKQLFPSLPGPPDTTSTKYDELTPSSSALLGEVKCRCETRKREEQMPGPPRFASLAFHYSLLVANLCQTNMQQLQTLAENRQTTPWSALSPPQSTRPIGHLPQQYFTVMLETTIRVHIPHNTSKGFSKSHWQTKPHKEKTYRKLSNW